MGAARNLPTGLGGSYARGRNIETLRAKLDHAEACPRIAAATDLTDACERPQTSIDANVALTVSKGSYTPSLSFQ